MDVPTHEELIELIETFLERHDMAHTRFGADATGDPNLVGAIRKGRSPSLALLHRIKAFMADRDAQLHAAADSSIPEQSSPGKAEDFTAQVPA